MRVVLDTNVLISGIFFKGPPFRILQAWRDGSLSIVASNAILSEYVRTTTRLAMQYPDINISEFLDLLTIKAEIVSEAVFPKGISRHYADDKFILCALAGKVPIIITGDNDLLELHPYQTIEIIKPSIFANRFLRKIT
jgi:putative PIN family toxin of toxin-antitoxin system